MAREYLEYQAEQAKELIASNPVHAHEVLFPHNHTRQTASFQKDLVFALHSTHPRIVIEAFRKAGKSTLSEEAIVILSSLVRFHNCLIIGASYERACERLENIKHEFDTNEVLEQIFGVQRQDKSRWTESRIVLANGVIIQAKGVGQSLRGVKHHQYPPDFVLIDDLEDEESVRTPSARKERLRWLYKTLIAALAKDARIRFLGNRLDPEAVIVQISKDANWWHLFYPIMVKDEQGEDKPTWPEMFDLLWIYNKRDELQRLGLFEDFNQEYMCEADTPQARIFRPEHFERIVVGRVRTWEATWVMVDPAKSTGKRSATTAIVVWSWIQRRLVIWEALLGYWLPDEIIAKILDIDTEYRPVVIGVEATSLDEFINQPLRQAQITYGRPLPLRPMAAKKYTQSRGKEDFIKSLQPFLAAGEVSYAKDLPELTAQFLSFPKGQIDGPNALAYALSMRPGGLVYDDFSQANIVETVALRGALPFCLAVHATGGYVTAVLVQYDGLMLTIIRDYVDEGEPGQIAGAVVRRAQIDAGGRGLHIVAPPKHFNQWTNIGLRQAVQKIPAEIGAGTEPGIGREEIRRLLRAQIKGMPAVQVGHDARWTLNAFSGGYARALDRRGDLADEPEDNVYSSLMLGLESWAGLGAIRAGMLSEDGVGLRATADGRLYRSAMVDRDGRAAPANKHWTARLERR